MLDVVAKADGHAVSFLDIEGLQTTREGIAGAVESIVREGRFLVVSNDAVLGLAVFVWGARVRAYAGRSPYLATVDEKYWPMVCSSKAGYKESEWTMMGLIARCIPQSALVCAMWSNQRHASGGCCGVAAGATGATVAPLGKPRIGLS